MPVAHDINDEAIRTAIKDRQHLIRFLNTSGRQFWVMRSEHLVEALPDPVGDVLENGKVIQEGSVRYVQNIVSMYRDHRRTIPGDKEGSVRDEVLEVSEFDALIEWAKQEREKALARSRRTS